MLKKSSAVTKFIICNFIYYGIIEPMKRKTIRNHNDFLTPRDAMYVCTDCVVVKVKPAKYPSDARYGLVVPKKMFKKAVHRNRAKRLLRDWIACHEDLMLNKYDYIFISRDTILDCSRVFGRHEIGRALRKIIRLDKADVAEK